VSWIPRKIAGRVLELRVPQLTRLRRLSLGSEATM